ncbi:dihydroxyacetone kinase subunit DhaK [Actinacidiphila epipremni]|jgi:dihydroxyacetone kinase-like protein|uniref:Dihydroxyacetone kinase subunit DhaK n=1 Tax=Actinacidiphila epipremni TaxID=2053013 RepID=A0ABX0ZT05_9ACTN|nr:dihydroxyacetone kinase subunit DhaK [Actinacidiphila epipremni]NJP44633.1 dihydroxyacetone kinase subunit DhaK [Actinacidiphila epipremni]
MKKLINSPETVVADSLRGLAIAHRELSVDVGKRVVVRGDAPVPGKVGILSGGGSGHEPLHVGYVGRGMLDAACPGEIFTSPSPQQILEATRRVDGGRGVLHIVKNYTGDVMNFEMAGDLARARGIEVRAVTVGDDVANDGLTTAGRRGVGATVLVEKICGAAAERRWPLARVADLGNRVIANARSMGIALTSCTVPSARRPTFTLGEDEMEVGIGMHGETGRFRHKLVPAREVAAILLDRVLADMPLEPGEQVLAFVNGMGATPLMELYIVLDEVARLLDARGLTLQRTLTGTYMAALDMAGCSLTVLRLDEEMTSLWDAPVATPALTWGTV